MKKVYCGDCRWDRASPHSFATAWAIYGELVTGINFTCRKRASHLKTDYNCPHYKRKWWKVWVR